MMRAEVVRRILKRRRAGRRGGFQTLVTALEARRVPRLSKIPLHFHDNKDRGRSCAEFDRMVLVRLLDIRLEHIRALLVHAC